MVAARWVRSPLTYDRGGIYIGLADGRRCYGGWGLVHLLGLLFVGPRSNRRFCGSANFLASVLSMDV